MPDFSDAPSGLEPPTVIDHVLLPVADLEFGARLIGEKAGLTALPGGRHATGGTANYIVPLGRQYLELIAIVDEKAAVDNRLGGRVMQAVKRGKTFVAWALRTTDLDALRGKLLGAGWKLPEIPGGSRRRPDGQELRWRTQDIALGSEPSAIPFVIEWQVPEGLHPGAVGATHKQGPTSIRRVILGARNPEQVRSQLQLLLGDSDMYEVHPAESDGVEQLLLAHPGGEAVLR